MPKATASVYFHLLKHSEVRQRNTSHTSVSGPQVCSHAFDDFNIGVSILLISLYTALCVLIFSTVQPKFSLDKNFAQTGGINVCPCGKGHHRLCVIINLEQNQFAG